MATQKPGEWANSLLARFEDQVNVKIIKNHQLVKRETQKKNSFFEAIHRCIDWKNCANETENMCEWNGEFVIVLKSYCWCVFFWFYLHSRLFTFCVEKMKDLWMKCRLKEEGMDGWMKERMNEWNWIEWLWVNLLTRVVWDRIIIL